MGHGTATSLSRLDQREMCKEAMVVCDFDLTTVKIDHMAVAASVVLPPKQAQFLLVRRNCVCDPLKLRGSERAGPFGQISEIFLLCLGKSSQRRMLTS